MAETLKTAVTVVGIDIGKNSFHIVGLDERGAIVLRQKWSRGQVESRFANMPPRLIGMEACVGAHHLSRRLRALGHDARLMPAKYVRPYSKGQKNDFRDASGRLDLRRLPGRLATSAFRRNLLPPWCDLCRRRSPPFWNCSWSSSIHVRRSSAIPYQSKNMPMSPIMPPG